MRALRRWQAFAHGFIDDDRTCEVFATGHHAVADRIDLRKAADGRLGVVHQDIEQLGKAFLHGHISHVIGGLLEIGGERNVHECAWRDQPFQQGISSALPCHSVSISWLLSEELPAFTTSTRMGISFFRVVNKMSKKRLGNIIAKTCLEPAWGHARRRACSSLKCATASCSP